MTVLSFILLLTMPIIMVDAQSPYTIGSYSVVLDLSSSSIGGCDMSVRETITLRPLTGALLSTFTRTLTFPSYSDPSISLIGTPTITIANDANAKLNSATMSATNGTATMVFGFTSTAVPITIAIDYEVHNIARTVDSDNYLIQTLWYPFTGFNVPLYNTNMSIIVPSYSTGTFSVGVTPSSSSSSLSSSSLLSCSLLETSTLTRTVYCPTRNISSSVLSSTRISLIYSPSSTRAQTICPAADLSLSDDDDSSSSSSNAIRIGFGVLGAFFLLVALCIARKKYSGRYPCMSE